MGATLLSTETNFWEKRSTAACFCSTAPLSTTHRSCTITVKSRPHCCCCLSGRMSRVKREKSKCCQFFLLELFIMSLNHYRSPPSTENSSDIFVDKNVMNGSEICDNIQVASKCWSLLHSLEQFRTGERWQCQSNCLSSFKNTNFDFFVKQNLLSFIRNGKLTRGVGLKCFSST